jgi:hypothetical protein
VSLIDHDAKTILLSVHYWGPYRSGKSTSLSCLRARLTGSAFEIDDEPFLPSLEAARSARPTSVFGGMWTSPPFSEIRGYALSFCFQDWSGFPVDVNDDPRWQVVPQRFFLVDGDRDRVDAVIFVASSAEEDLEANRLSLRELTDRDLLVRTVVQLNKHDLPSALPVERLIAELGIAQRPSIASIAREGKGVFEAVKHAGAIGLAGVGR